MRYSVNFDVIVWGRPVFMNWRGRRMRWGDVDGDDRTGRRYFVIFRDAA